MNLESSILDSISTGILVLSGDLTVTALNASGQALLDTSEARCLGVHAEKLLQHSHEWLGSLTQVLESDSPHASRSVALTLHSGQEIHVDVIITPFPHADGSTGLLVELMAVDRLLRISRDGSQQYAQETSRAVIRGLAHEIKNPLGGVRGAAQLLARELADEDLAEYTRIIIREADRLRDLVDRLLGPNRQLALQPLNIHEVLEHVRSLISAEADNRVTIIRDYDPSLPEFPCDRAQLIQAVLNIMRNAVQAATDPEQCQIILRSRSQRQFTVGTQLHRLVCRVDIIDNGPGIPADLQPAVFAPMVTGRADGTGLGLSIAQSIIHLHGGSLECESYPGETRFTFYLPMETPHA
ncbi:MAG: PAS domain-containing protein [Halioglobus sp.]|nr:PAS domain-containing protein [Halioglobus sp.]